MFGESWEADGPDEGDCVDGYTITWAREFRYDATRARYLNRELDPEALEEGDLVALSEVWTDYDGDSSYGDFELDGNPPEPSDLRSYEPGVALKDPWDESSGIEYYHADLIGSTRAMTDYTGASASTVCYTAFGEKLEAGHHRYGYAGSWGYQAHDVPDGDPVQFLHVGWRYYDPGTGRFLQRDPMGVFAGSNVYDYVYGQATVGTDPYGLVCQGCTQNTEPAIKLIDEKPMPEKDSEEPEIEAWVELDGGSVKFGTKIKAKSSWWQRFVNNCVTLPLAAGVYAGQKASDTSKVVRVAAEATADLVKGVPLPVCFAEGTSIWTPEGITSIECVKKGDLLLGMIDNSIAIVEVEAVYVSQTKEYLVIDVGSDQLICTKEHPLKTVFGDWAPAGSFAIGDFILTAKSEAVTIKSMTVKQSLDEPIRVYNLHVSGHHEYIVGETMIRAHNKILVPISRPRK